MKCFTRWHAAPPGLPINTNVTTAMNQFLAFVSKEFKHVFRDWKTLLILLGLPIAEIILFGFALTNEIKNTRVVIVDNAHDVASERITDRISASRYFDIEKSMMNAKQIEAAFREGKIKLAIVFPANFADDIAHLNKASIQVIADASDPNTATALTNYVSAIVGDYQAELQRNINIP